MKILLDANVIGEIARPDSPYRANLLSRFNNFSNADFFYLNAVHQEKRGNLMVNPSPLDLDRASMLMCRKVIHLNFRYSETSDCQLFICRKYHIPFDIVFLLAISLLLFQQEYISTEYPRMPVDGLMFSLATFLHTDIKKPV